VGICKSKGWVLPTVYQGVYNCFDRTIETECVLPCVHQSFTSRCSQTGALRPQIRIASGRIQPSSVIFFLYLSEPSCSSLPISASGGFLTGKYLNRAEAQPGSHFDPNWNLSWFYLQRYVPMLPALQEVKDIAVGHLLSYSRVTPSCGTIRMTL